MAVEPPDEELSDDGDCGDDGHENAYMGRGEAPLIYGDADAGAGESVCADPRPCFWPDAGLGREVLPGRQDLHVTNH